MKNMFSGSYSIKLIDLSYLNASSVTNMEGMFKDCYALTSINFDNFNTSSKITNMKSMFQYCYSLRTIYLSYLDVSSITNMENMFMHNYQLISVNLSNFNLSSVII